MQEESLTEELNSCDVTKLGQERNVENYNFTLGHVRNGRPPCNNNSSDDEKEVEQRLTNKRTNADRRNTKLRLGKRNNSSTYFESQKGPARTIEDLSTSVESMDADVATDITTKLNEKKELLISKYLMYLFYFILLYTILYTSILNTI